MRPPGVAAPPIVLLVPGGDSTKEKLYHFALQIVVRGMAVAAFDGPGQGFVSRFAKIRPDFEVPIRAVTDYLLARGDLDGERLAVGGISYGGLFACRAAAFDDRVKAVVSVSSWYTPAGRYPGIDRVWSSGRSMDSRLTELTEQQRDLQALCRKFVDEQVTPFVVANSAREWDTPALERSPRDLLIAADQIGLRDFGIPQEHGGIDVDTVSQVVMIEELGRGDPGFTVCIGQNWKVTREFARHASPELLATWMDTYRADPTFLWAHCLTEPRGASDRVLPYDAPEASMQTRAVPDGDGWVLNGVKHYVSNAGVANAFIVFANTNPAAGVRDGVSNFLVPADTPGLSIGRINEKVGQRYNINAEIVLEDCRVPGEYLLVRDTALRKNAAYMLQGRVLNAARALGVMQAAYEKAARFARETFQGGKVIIKHQLVAGRLADIVTTVEAARSLVYRAARAADAGADDAPAIALMAKLHCSQVVLEVTRRVLELHAGSGVMVGDGVEKHYRDAAIFPHTDGTADITRLKIIKALFPESAGLYAGPDAEFRPDGTVQPAVVSTPEP